MRERFVKDLSGDYKVLRLYDTMSDWSAAVDIDDVNQEEVFAITDSILSLLNNTYKWTLPRV